MTITEPAHWDDLFVRHVDEQPVQFVRPADIDGPCWGAYDERRFLGTVYAEPDRDGSLWRVGPTAERHRHLEDAVRALRRPLR